MSYVDVGSLRERIEILDCRMVEDKIWQWVPLRPGWAKVEVDGSSNYFSKVGIGARNAKLILRRQPLTLHHALRWGGQHLFLTQITKHPSEREYMEARAALVDTVTCRAERTTTVVDTRNGNRPKEVTELVAEFPAVLAEKYVKYQPEETHAKAVVSYVLVTPKAIRLLTGDLVTISEGDAAGVYNVQIRHILDSCKNEYEIVYSRDV